MKIAILTLGTRGDVQPYAVLGKALKERGHQVTLSTAKNFEGLVKSYGIDFVPVEADYQAILNSEEGKKIMKGNPFAIKRNLNQWIYPLIKNSLSEFYQLATANDRVVYHVKTLADCFADQFPEKMIRAMVVPAVQATSEFANPAFSGLPIPKILNKFSYKLTDMGMSMLKQPITEFRRELNLPLKYNIPETKFIYGISPNFLPKPNDLPNNAHFTGFWFGESSDSLPEDLISFIKSGEPPILITFGSMPFQCKFDIQKALLKVPNTRIIVVKGWGLQNTELLEIQPNIKVIDAAPYEKLFPLCQAIMHHGGIGTTSECLRAGKPFVIYPILHPIGDQLFWGRQSYKLKIALKPTPLAKLTEIQFIEDIKSLITNSNIQINSQSFQTTILNENGIEKAVQIIEESLYFSN